MPIKYAVTPNNEKVASEQERVTTDEELDKQQKQLGTETDPAFRGRKLRLITRDRLHTPCLPG